MTGEWLEMEYRDDKGNKLYGFSQESLEKTNREIKKTNKLLIFLTFIVLLFLLVMIFSVIYIDTNDIITQLIHNG